MTELALTESLMDPESASYRNLIPAGEFWLYELSAGQILRIVDLEGNQAVDTLFYSAADPVDRYSALDTIREQGNVYLTAGTELLSTDLNVLLTIVADTCGRHDTLGGACAAESNSVRYPLEKRYMHNCRDSFVRAMGAWHPSLSKRDLTNNINFFMNVPISPDGGSSFADGISDAGKYVELRAEMDVVCAISNCPQLNNPCNAYNPTPAEVIVWDS